MLLTPASALEPIATAVLAALGASTTLAALTTVVNDVDQGTPRPYTVIGNFTEIPWNTMAEFGKSCTFQAHTVSDAAGDQQGFRIQSAVIGALDYQKFSLTNHRMVQCKFESSTHWSEEAVGSVKIRHFVASFRVDVTQSA